MNQRILLFPIALVPNKCLYPLRQLIHCSARWRRSIVSARFCSNRSSFSVTREPLIYRRGRSLHVGKIQWQMTCFKSLQDKCPLLFESPATPSTTPQHPVQWSKLVLRVCRCGVELDEIAMATTADNHEFSRRSAKPQSQTSFWATWAKVVVWNIFVTAHAIDCKLDFYSTTVEAN